MYNKYQRTNISSLRRSTFLYPIFEKIMINLERYTSSKMHQVIILNKRKIQIILLLPQLQSLTSLEFLQINLKIFFLNLTLKQKQSLNRISLQKWQRVIIFLDNQIFKKMQKRKSKLMIMILKIVISQLKIRIMQILVYQQSNMIMKSRI